MHCILWIKGLRLVLKGFVVTMHGGANMVLETKAVEWTTPIVTSHYDVPLMMGIVTSQYPRSKDSHLTPLILVCLNLAKGILP